MLIVLAQHTKTDAFAAAAQSMCVSSRTLIFILNAEELREKNHLWGSSCGHIKNSFISSVSWRDKLLLVLQTLFSADCIFGQI